MLTASKTLKRFFGQSKLFVWGSSNYTGKAPRDISQYIEGNVKSIGIGNSHMGIVTECGKLYMMGNNKYGELGDPFLKSQTVLNEPHLVEFFEKNKLKVEKVVCDSNHTLVLTKGGRVFSFGNGKYSKMLFLGSLFARTLALGHETNENLISPKMIKALKGKNIKDISTNKDSAMAVDDNNTLYVWGRGEFGVNGMGSSDSIQVPKENTIMTKILESLDNPKILKIMSCSNFSSILLENGDVYSFGNNDQGVMGLENTLGIDMTEAISFPQPMYRPNMKYKGEDTKIVDIDLGEFFSIVKVRNESGEEAVYWAGRKLAVQHQKIDFDFDEDKPLLIGASDKGHAFTTESNKLVCSGNFLKTTPVNVETGINIVDIESQFGAGQVSAFGGKYSDRYLIMKE